MLNAVQENSPVNVVQVLEKVIVSHLIYTVGYEGGKKREGIERNERKGGRE